MFAARSTLTAQETCRQFDSITATLGQALRKKSPGDSADVAKMKPLGGTTNVGSFSVPLFCRYRCMDLNPLRSSTGTKTTRPFISAQKCRVSPNRTACAR